MILVSACLAGKCCRYDGCAKPDEGIVAMVNAGEAIPVCPECLGGLPVPRDKAEIQFADGGQVLQGNARVVTSAGRDVTAEFIAGAQKTLELCRLHNIGKAILKGNSPSCGTGIIYDGSFTGKRKAGDGVTAALLRQNGIKIESR